MVAPSRDAVRFARIAGLVCALGWLLVAACKFAAMSRWIGGSAVVVAVGEALAGIAWIRLDRHGARSLALGIASAVAAVAAAVGAVTGEGTFLSVSMIAAGGCAVPLRSMPLTRCFAVGAGVAMAGSMFGSVGLLAVGVVGAALAALAMIGEFPDPARSA